jgi:hypothetical protein
MKQIADIPKTGQLYKNVSPIALELTTGVVLSIDPSIGSSSSSPGWAVYNCGSLYRSGTIDTGGSHLPLWKRARTLADEVKSLCDDFGPDVLVYEDIPATSGFNANAQASLLKAVGIVLACSNTEMCLGIHPASWKNYVRPTYTKGDEEDAIEIGWVAIELASHIRQAAATTSGKRTRRPVQD